MQTLLYIPLWSYCMDYPVHAKDAQQCFGVKNWKATSMLSSKSFRHSGHGSNLRRLNMIMRDQWVKWRITVWLFDALERRTKSHLDHFDSLNGAPSQSHRRALDHDTVFEDNMTCLSAPCQRQDLMWRDMSTASYYVPFYYKRTSRIEDDFWLKVVTLGITGWTLPSQISFVTDLFGLHVINVHCSLSLPLAELQSKQRLDRPWQNGRSFSRLPNSYRRCGQIWLVMNNFIDMLKTRDIMRWKQTLRVKLSQA